MPENTGLSACPKTVGGQSTWGLICAFLVFSVAKSSHDGFPSLTNVCEKVNLTFEFIVGKWGFVSCCGCSCCEKPALVTQSLLVEFGVNKNSESFNFVNYTISIETINNIE